MTAPIQVSRKKAAKKPGVRWEALNQSCAFAEPASLTPVQRVAHSAYWYASLVEAGGHHEYFAHVPKQVSRGAKSLDRLRKTYSGWVVTLRSLDQSFDPPAFPGAHSKLAASRS